jgi:hypothetical protein
MAKHLKLPNTFRTPKHQVGVRAVERKWPFDSVRRSPKQQDGRHEADYGNAKPNPY